ncbi:MAG: thioredoxin family protein [Burkholderiales bacterium]
MVPDLQYECPIRHQSGKIEDLKDITSYAVMSTPGMVIDGKAPGTIASTGTILSGFTHSKEKQPRNA